MSRKRIILISYMVIAVIFGIYQWKFGDTAWRGFAYNMGRGLTWPFAIFPSLGNIFGAIILLIIVAVILAS